MIAGEPTTSLDSKVLAETLSLLKELREQAGCGVIFTTHDLGVAARIPQWAAVMSSCPPLTDTVEKVSVAEARSR